MMPYAFRSQMTGRVPGGGWPYLKTSREPSESYQSAGHQPSKRVFNPLPHPVGLHLSIPQLLTSTIIVG